MTTDNALLFIDANVYLDLYRTNTGKLLLAPLCEQAAHIFVTRQIVNEVNCNKVAATEEFLTKTFKPLELKTHNVPDHLFGANEQQNKDILSEMKEVKKSIDKINNKVKALSTAIIEKVGQSEDEVSTALLTPVFARAVSHDAAQLERAKERYRLGRPPGKHPARVGDQLNWEQILSKAADIDGLKLWIITRDRDYGTIYGGKGYLNQFLHDELLKTSPGASVFLFDDILSGIKHFAAITGANAEKQLTPEQIEAIKKEKEASTPIDWIYTANTDASAMTAMNAHPVFQSHGPVFGWFSAGTVPSAGTAMLNISSSGGTPSKFGPEGPA